MASPFRPAQTLMVQYAQYHRDRRNIATHWVGIPLIIVALGVWLAAPLPGLASLSWAALFWALSTAWYLGRGALLLGAATALFNGVMILLGMQLAALTPLWGMGPALLGLLVFVIGWAFQFLGHLWEGRKPAFADDLVGLLVGPMFLVGEALMVMGLLAPMREQIAREAGALR
jgi:uncharacterized membrane protein YGL010W